MLTLCSFVAKLGRFSLILALMTVFVVAGLPVTAQAEDETPSVSLDPYPEYSSADAVTFTGTAAYDNSPIASVECRVDDGPWSLATAIDGQFGDETTESYSFTTRGSRRWMACCRCQSDHQSGLHHGTRGLRHCRVLC